MTEAFQPAIIDFSRASAETTTAAPPNDSLIAGSPKHTVQNFFTDPTNQFFAGVWGSTTGKWRVRYKESEFCHITAGVVRIESVNGERWTFKAGDAFVIPLGFEGVWEVIEPVRKLYVIFERAPV